MKIAQAQGAHWIVGLVNDASDGEPADGYIVTLYTQGNKADNITDIIGPTGNSGVSNIYLINCFELSTPCGIGDTLVVEVNNSDTYYTAGPASVIVTGAGYDMAPDMTLTKIIITEINFTINSIAWGQGAVDGGAVRAVLDSYAGSVLNGSWAPQSVGLELKNIGTTNVKLELKSNKNASSFIGSGGSEENEDFEWKIVNTTASCNETWSDTTFTNVSIDYKIMCPMFYYSNTRDNVTIHLRIVIPSDTNKIGAQSAVLTALATEL